VFNNPDKILLWKPNTGTNIAIYVSAKPRFFLKVILLTIFFSSQLFSSAIAQSNFDYDEVSITLNVQRIGQIEVPALIRDQAVYLPVSDIFDFLHIKNAVSVKIDSISGSFINPQSKFIIDKAHNRIIYIDKIYAINPSDIICTATNLYLKSTYFGKVFGLNCTFSFRDLSVILSTELELPVIREMRQEQMRTNVNKLKGLVKADTTIGRSYPLFHFGTADYSIVNSTNNQLGTRDARVGLGIGGIIAGGETTVVLNYDNNEPVSERQQYYLWKFVNNDNAFAKQLSVGKLFGQSISSIYAPVVGVQLTNAPTTYRRSFGTYTLSDHTRPNWIVELYVNGVLITYVKADASGFYTFSVPLVYGNSVVKLRFYGPYGEERSSEQNISIPFNFLPKNEFEYTATTGIVEDDKQSRFSRLVGNYGLSRNITLGGGAEHLSSIASGAIIPFVNTSIRLLPNLFLSAEYDYGVRSKAILNYNLSSGLQLEVNDTWYKQGQTAINNFYLEDRKATLSLPIRAYSFSGYSRLTVEQIILPFTKYTTADWLISSVFGKFSTSINTYGLFINDNQPYLCSDLSVATRIFKNTLLTQQVQYEYVEKKVIGLKSTLEKRLFKNGYVNLSYQRNFASNINNIEMGLRYDFSFAQVGASLRASNHTVDYLQSVSGSLVYDRKSKLADFNNFGSVGTGTVILIPYLDLNGNGKRDLNEPKAAGLKIRINGGRVKQNIADTTITITNLEAYTNYNIELDATAFDRVAWQLPKKNYAVIIDPNAVKQIEVPILVSGEASGRITLKTSNGEQGLSRILVGFYNERSVLVARTVSESDGYFTFLGLLPGRYLARLDSAQLNKLHMFSIATLVPFTIARNNDGSVVDGLEFTVRQVEVNKRTKDSTRNRTNSRISDPNPILLDTGLISHINTPVKMGTIINAISPFKTEYVAKAHTLKLFVKSDQKNSSFITGQNRKNVIIQTAHFKMRGALRSKAILTKRNYTVIIVKADKPYLNVRIVKIKGIGEAKVIIKKIKRVGFPDAYILKRKNVNIHAASFKKVKKIK